MPQRFVLSSLTLSLMAAFGVGPAWAIGFARVQPSVTMGAPLDFVVGVRLDSGELLTPECVSAEVWIGDNPLPRSAVGASVETSGVSPAIRVRTLNRVDEPVVTVNITAGCEGKVTRRFTIFADPPGLMTALPAVVSPEPLAAAQPAGSAAAVPMDRPIVRSAPAARSPAVSPVQRARPVQTARAAPQRRAPAAVELRPTTAAPGKPEAASESAEDLKLGKPNKVVASDGSGARLRLDAPSVTLAADRAAIEAAERRAAELSAVRAAIDGVQAAASSASSRVASMEASVEALKKESKTNRDTMLKLQAALADADERGRWTPWLLAAVLGLLGVAGWLYSRLRRTESEKQQAWWNSSHAVGSPGTLEPAAPVPEPAAPAPETASRSAPAAAARDSLGAPPLKVAPTTFFESPVPPSQSTQPMPAGLVVPDSPLRDVSIEELLDVEQQAEFFVVLGQDEAAIDLLVGHLRSTGGSSPLPYLKLLEIYHRRNDQASYDRMRRRFNERFNAIAPDWATGLQAGRSLEEYPGVIAQIQESWPRPVDSMADLETLLFRTTGGDVFDLPAYRDVLFLFTLARDLQEMAEHDAPRVDVLLPLGHGSVQDTREGSGFSESLSMGLQPAVTANTAANKGASPAAGLGSTFGSLDFEPRKAP